MELTKTDYGNVVFQHYSKTSGSELDRILGCLPDVPYIKKPQILNTVGNICMASEPERRPIEAYVHRIHLNRLF
jgi:hypothetical protein